MKAFARIFGLISLGFCAEFALAQDVATVAARAQAAYFAGSAAELIKLGDSIGAWAKSSNSREQYAYAFVRFRVLQLSVIAKRKDDASKSGDACTSTLDSLLKRDPKSAEGHALQSACFGYLANLGGFAAIRNGSRSGKSMEAALAIEPRNPRVVLVDGFGVYFRPKFVGGDKAKGCQRFTEAAAGFEAARTTGVPSSMGIDWGAAEAYYWVGRCAKDAGDTAGARRAFDKALGIAPDFVAAKRG